MRIGLLIIFLFLLCLINPYKSLSLSPDRYIAPKTLTKNGIDFRQFQGSVGKYGGTLNLSTFGSGPKTFNLWASTDATSSELASLMFDSLFDTHPVTGDIIPRLAKSYEIIDGGKTIIVTLRNGIKWSDGKEITSDDVVYTWNEIVFGGLEGGGFQSLCLVDGKFPQVRKIDNKKIEFKTHIVFAPFLRQIGYAPLPKHVIEPHLKTSKDKKATFLRLWGADANPNEIITNGPFKLYRYVKGERVEFVRNPSYYSIDLEGNRLPYFEKLVYHIVQDKSFELFKFLANELDVISIRGEDVELVKELEKKNNFSVVNLGPSSGTEFLVFNLSMGFISETRTEWFNNLNFRKAISYAIDREGIVDNVLAGIGKPLFTPESLASIYLNKKIADGYPRNLEYARKLLFEGGFSLNKSGHLVDKKGNKVEFTILTNAENTTRQAIGVIIQDDLNKLGMKVNLRPLDFNTLIGRSDTGDWDAIIIGFTGGFFEPNEGANVWRLNGRLHMFDNKPHKPRSWELEIDKIFNEATKFVEFEKRKKLYDRFQEIVYEQLPFIYLESPLRVMAYQNTIRNVIPTIYGGVLHNLENIYKEKSES